MSELSQVKSIGQLAVLTQVRQQVVRLMQDAGLLRTEQECEKCHHSMVLRGTQRRNAYKWICANDDCEGSECSIRKGSVFQNSRLSLAQLLRITLEWSQNSHVKRTRAESGVSRKTVNEWFKLLREKCSAYVEENRRLIGGPGLTVEIDESLIVKQLRPQPPRGAGWTTTVAQNVHDVCGVRSECQTILHLSCSTFSSSAAVSES
ncbi:uncharacterized protein LOC121590900 [Anopheles merus]|uniref:uncharacterized protein LOC121590900 n=1 Tax=Anopheles merus TaxID=30066 RepID=UPI001BE459C7|nr:uncharacterized protein LOC121590900 [Anopheles merus]